MKIFTNFIQTSLKSYRKIYILNEQHFIIQILEMSLMIPEQG